MDDYYDYVLIGTSYTTSLLSLQLSQNHRVLHISSSPQYGGDHSLSNLSDLLKVQQTLLPYSPGARLLAHTPPKPFPAISHIARTPYGTGRITALDATSSMATVSLPYGLLHTPTSTLAQSSTPLPPLSPRFAFPGLTPNLFFAGTSPTGPASTVQTLIDCGVADYLDFTCTTAHNIIHNLVSHVVPVTKSALFKSSLLKPLEKRKLTKVITSTIQFQSKDDVNKFDSEETLTTQRTTRVPQNLTDLTPATTDALTAILTDPIAVYKTYLQTTHSIPPESLLSNLLLYSLPLPSPATPTATLLQSTATHVLSLATYQNQPSATLTPCYGAGEIVQGLCRKSAVNGTTFCLGVKDVVTEREADGGARVKFNIEGYAGEEGEVGDVKCGWILEDYCGVDEADAASTSLFIVRYVMLVATDPEIPFEGSTLTTYPPDEALLHPAYAIVGGGEVRWCPPEYVYVYVTTHATDPKGVLDKLEEVARMVMPRGEVVTMSAIALPVCADVLEEKHLRIGRGEYNVSLDGEGERARKIVTDVLGLEWNWKERREEVDEEEVDEVARKVQEMEAVANTNTPPPSPKEGEVGETEATANINTPPPPPDEVKLGEVASPSSVEN